MLQGTQKIMKQGSPILTGSALDLNIAVEKVFLYYLQERMQIQDLQEMDRLV